MAEITCINCKKKAEHHAKQMCTTCYKKLLWTQPIGICKRCKREIKMHAKGLCPGCYNSVFHIEKVRLHNARKYHNIDPELYKKVIKECTLCGFNKVVELHHLDLNHDNNVDGNLIGLCPNHHKLVHHRNFRKEVFKELEKKGFKIPNVYPDDEFFK